MNKPLQGIRIVELGTHIAIPKSARTLCDWGAEVIKVGPPSGEAWRDSGRRWGVPYQADNNPLFQSENMNKKSLCLNLKTDQGKEAMKALLKTADVFMTNTRMQPLTRLGFSYDQVKEYCPNIIYVHFTGYGNKGPDKDKPGFDVAAFWSRVGMPIEWTNAGERPFKPTACFGDATVAAMVTSGILLALYNRLLTGKGEFINTSLMANGLWYNAAGVVMGQEKYGHVYPKDIYNQTNPLNPLYRSKEGDWILISETKWEARYDKYMEFLGHPEFIGDDRFTTLPEVTKPENMRFLIDFFTEEFAKRSTKEILTFLREVDVVHEKLMNPNDVCKDEQAFANNYLEEYTLEGGETVILPNNPLSFQNIERRSFHPAPHLGADNHAILKELGYTDDQIKDMETNNAIYMRP